jgi:ABC-type nitrate/sulfonate/bicarbonate transport system substrate-binding protein
LKTGRVDAFLYGTPNAIALLLVDSGELRILANMRDILPKPFVSLVAFATDDLIEKNPDLAKRFVGAALETAKYLKENPSYAIELYMKRVGAPKDLAEKAVSQLDWTPAGRGSGSDLTVAITNVWQYSKESGTIPPSIDVKIEDAVDVRFLP